MKLDVEMAETQEHGGADATSRTVTEYALRSYEAIEKKLDLTFHRPTGR